MRKTEKARSMAKGTPSAQPQPQPSPPPRRRQSVRSTVAAVVSESRERAEVYARSPKMLQGLVSEAAGKMAMLDQRIFKDSWAYLLAMLRLLKAYSTRRYKELARDDLLTVISAVAYFVSPLDLIPDFAEGVGYVDDAMVVRAVHRQVQEALDRFMEWESGILR